MTSQDKIIRMIQECWEVYLEAHGGGYRFKAIGGDDVAIVDGVWDFDEAIEQLYQKVKIMDDLFVKNINKDYKTAL